MFFGGIKAWDLYREYMGTHKTLRRFYRLLISSFCFGVGGAGLGLRIFRLRVLGLRMRGFGV